MIKEIKELHGNISVNFWEMYTPLGRVLFFVPSYLGIWLGIIAVMGFLYVLVGFAYILITPFTAIKYLGKALSWLFLAH